jgi:tRNA(His) guanylyltransferase
MHKDSIGNRMKDNYENRYRVFLTRRTPAIVRLDGRAFHTLTRGLNKPFDYDFSNTMLCTASYLCAEIQGAKCAYVQSDEISILLTDYDKLTTDAWFDYNVQKMTSVSAGLASAYFTKHWNSNGGCAVFDSRVFNIPIEEVCNYFIWRQLDWVRNSVQMLSQANFSHKELHKKNQADMHEMLFSKGINWADLEDRWKNGVFISKEKGESWLPNHRVIFKKDRDLVERLLTPEIDTALVLKKDAI